MRVVPNDNDTTGFFCALIKKNNELPWIISKFCNLIKVLIKGYFCHFSIKSFGYSLQTLGHGASNEYQQQIFNGENLTSKVICVF